MARLLSGFVGQNVRVPPRAAPSTLLNYLEVMSEGEDYVGVVSRFEWNESPFMHHSTSGVRSAFLRERGIPAKANIDDACQCDGFSTLGGSPKVGRRRNSGQPQQVI